MGITLLEVRSADGQFGFQQIRSDHLPIEVERLDLDIEPTAVVVDPTESVLFQVTVTDSEHPEMVEIDPLPPATGTADLLGFDGVNTHSILYTAPPATIHFPWR